MCINCNHDCLNCPYPDAPEECLNAPLTREEYRELDRLEKEIIRPKTKKQRKVAAHKKAYYEANREKLAAYKKAYYEANREKLEK